MTRTLLLTAALAALPLTAMAQAERFSDTSYIAASRCVFYAGAAQLQTDAFNVAALREAVDGQYRSRSANVRREARAYASEIRSASESADSESEVARLRGQRDAVCAPYVRQGLVQIDSPPAS